MKKIAILITGEIRTCSLGMGKNTKFIETFNKYLLTDDMTKNFEINIFFVTDKINKKKAYNYFGKRLKGLLTLNDENIANPLNLQEYIDNYLSYYQYRKKNIELFPIVEAPRASYVYMFYKLYCAYILMNEYEEQHNYKHDFIFRMRPDFYINKEVYPQILKMVNNNLEMIISWDWGYLAKWTLNKHICNIIFCYGKYSYGEKIYDNNFFKKIGADDYYNYAKKNWRCWSESPEVQLWEHVINFYNDNNLSFEFLDKYDFFAINEDRHDIVNW